MLMYSERHDSKLEAIRRERHIKQWSRAEKEALVGGDPAVPTRVSDPGRERMTRR
jgi:predicted GIY-YIG superfamily endonuclease